MNSPPEGVQQLDIGSQRAASIEVQQLAKAFETTDGYEEVFDAVSFTVEPSSFVSLIGKSGSGKSTMLNIISNVLQPTSGTVSFRLEDDSDDVRVGYVFQSPSLLPWETCIQNIEYVHGDNPEYTEAVAKQYLDMVNLSDHYYKYPTQLSGGQRQRVGIARAFSIDPDILLMDEPFSSLDEITAEELRAELMNIWGKFHKTVLFVTHDITEAIELSDRILMLGDGKIFGDLEVPLERPREVDSNEFLKFRQEAIDKFHSLERGE